MDFANILSLLAEKAKNNLDEGNKTISDATAQAHDRAKMLMNPDMYGPPTPENTPESQKFNEQMSTSVIGAMQPVKLPGIAKLISKFRPESVQTAALRETADAAANAGLNKELMLTDVARAQQALSRGVDADARAAAQKQQRRLDVLNKLRLTWPPILHLAKPTT